MAERARAKKQSKGNGKAKAGHNSGQVPDEVYERWLAKIETQDKRRLKAKEAYDSENGKLQSLFKAAKDDGCNTTAIKRARKLDAEDHAQVAIDYADTGRVLRLRKSALADQLDLFAEIDHPPSVSSWLAGTQAGKAGAPIDDNPHTPGSDVFEEWNEGHRHGVGAVINTFTRGSASA